jgi:ribonuclease BN (tRNA processing enzyme)
MTPPSSQQPPYALSVTVLGSGTAVPWRGRSSPGLVVSARSEEDSYLVLVDPSAGSCQRLVERGYALSELSCVLLSHFHPDHTGDLAPLLFALKNPNLAAVGAGAPLRVCGPVGLHEHHAALRRVFGAWIEHDASRVKFEELRPGSARGFLSVGPLEITAHAVAHTDNSVGYRFEVRGGSTFAYSGDTDVCDGAIQAARNADLFVVECAFPEGQKHAGHLIPSEAGRLAMAANARRVVLTHLYPECRGHDLIEPCRRHFTGEVQVAVDGLTVNL